MAEPGLFALDNRLEPLSQFDDPLETLTPNQIYFRLGKLLIYSSLSICAF